MICVPVYNILCDILIKKIMKASNELGINEILERKPD